MLHIVRLLLLVAAVSACAPVVYGPNFQHIPDLSDASDMSINGSYGSGVKLNFAELSIAYALSPRIALMTSGYYARGGEYKTGSIRGEAIYLEPAIGFYYAELPSFRLSVFGAYGGGRQLHYLPKGGMIPVNWNRYSFLPAIEYRFGATSLTISNRIGYKFFDGGLSNLQLEYEDFEQGLHFRDYKPIMLNEPALTFSYHFDKFKFSIQWIETWPKHPEFPFDDFYAGVGLSYNFSTRKKAIIKPLY